MRTGVKLLLLTGLAICPGRGAATAAAVENADATLPVSSVAVTNIDQLSLLSRSDFNRGRPVSFTGTVTLVDTNRRRFVLQDATGALMWYGEQELDAELVGKRIRLDCAHGVPYAEAFPDFPLNSSGTTMESSFEAPSNWGDYHLNRMAGYLRPPQSGEYRFWIASDDSSELWMSADENPARVRKIAFVTDGSWTNPREWDRFPSQRSEAIYLRSEQAYYLEAFHEQGQQDDHLTVAWEGPGVVRSVIPGLHFTPWAGQAGAAVTNGSRIGILREYWTNYAVGSVVPITPSGPAGTAMTGTGFTVRIVGPSSWPEPWRVDLREPLSPENNFRWTQTEGIVNFVGTEGTDTEFELAAGSRRISVRVANWTKPKLHAGQNWHVQIQGVCEGVTDASGNQTVGIIWAPSSDCVLLTGTASNTNESVVSPDFPPTNSAGTFGGYYLARGAVTFDGSFAGRRYLYIQDVHGSVCVSDADRVFKNNLEIGQRIQVGGTLSPGKAGLRLVPITLRLLGWETLPIPAELGPDATYQDGQWAEVYGVVRSVGADGVFKIKGRAGDLSVWSPVMTVDEALVDCAVRLRGVVSLDVPDAPLLFVGSRQFVEIEERGPGDPFSLPPTPVRQLNQFKSDVFMARRVKVEGTVTYADRNTAYLQDDSGAVRLQFQHDVNLHSGYRLEVIGFPDASGSIRTLADLSLRKLGVGTVKPSEVDLREALVRKNDGHLIRVRGNLLAQKNRGAVQILELQSGHRVFEAVLASNHLQLPRVVPGSQLDVTGVCVANMIPTPGNPENLFMASVQVLLRSPADVIVQRGPPWWTPMKVVALIAFLLTVLGGTLLWVRLLGRRYELRQLAQLEFSRQILQSQEAERSRIAANLHDSLGQNLLVIKNQIRLAMQSVLDRSVVSKRLEEISGMASQVIEEVRQISHGLRPYQLERVGLTQTLRGTIRRISENSPIAFASRVDDVDGLFASDGEIHIYRILQEALTNVIKHSAATEATAIVKKEADSVVIVVRDNGRGLGGDGADGPELTCAGFGLSGINERARILHGKVLIDSDSGKGFRLTVEIPTPRLT